MKVERNVKVPAGTSPAAILQAYIKAFDPKIEWIRAKMDLPHVVYVYAFAEPKNYPRVRLSAHHFIGISAFLTSATSSGRVTPAAAQRDYLDRGGVLAGERKKRSAA